MATLNLTSLTCLRRQDLTNNDEPQIVVDGKVKWNGVIKKGQTVNLVPTNVSIGTVAKVVLNELDGKKSKQIGQEAQIDVEHPGAQPLVFKTSGAHYELFYSLAP